MSWIFLILIIISQIESIAIHPEYKSIDEHDIALLKLKTKIKRTVAVHEICLPVPDERFDGKNCIVSGWGSIRNGIYLY